MPEGRVVHRYHTTYGPSHTTTTRVGLVTYIDHYRHIDKPKAPPPDNNVTNNANSPSSGGGGSGSPPSSIPDNNVSPERPGTDWATRRQRFLRSLGYNIRVDGVWGPVSQRLWSQFVGSRGGAPTSFNPAEERRRIARARAKAERTRFQAIAKRSRDDATRALARVQGVQRRNVALERAAAAPQDAANPSPAHDRIEDRAAAERTREAARLALATRDAATHAQNLRTLRRLRQNPSTAATVSLHQFAALILDPQNGIDAADPRDVRLVQIWLRAHGHPNLKVDGVLGGKTHAVLVQALQRASAVERRRQVRRISEEFYGSGILQAGAPRPWWLPGSGPVPTAGELLELLQGGGFLAAVTLKQLVAQARSPENQFLAFKQLQLTKLAHSLYDGIIPEGIPGLGLPQDADQLTPLVFSHPEMQGPRAQAIFHSLAESSTLDEFQRHYDLALNELEREYRASQMEAAKDLPWWQDTLNAIGKPAEWMATLSVEAYTHVEETVQAIDAYFLGDDPERDSFGELLGELHDIYWQDEDVRWRLAQKRLEEMPVAERVLLEIIVDPLNLIPVARLSAAAARYGVKGALYLERTGASVAAHDSGLLAQALVGESDDVARILVGRTLMAPAEVGRAVAELARTTKIAVREGSYFARYVGAHQVYRAVVKATQLKGAAIAEARSGLAWAARNDFKAADGAPDFSKALLEDFDGGRNIGSAIDEASDRLRTGLDRIGSDLIGSLHRSGVSLYVDQSRRTLSTTGARLLARLLAEGRAMEIQRLALESARSVYESAVKQAEAALDPESASLAISRAESRHNAGRKAVAEYQRIIKQAGAYGQGGEIDAAIANRLNLLGDRFEMVIFPVLQRHLEEMAEAAGRKLFDEEGLWAERAGEMEAALRDEIAKGFDDAEMIDVANPHHEIAVRFSEAEKLASAEIRIERYRVIANFSRREAAGEAVDYGRLVRRLNEIDEEVWDHWRPVEGEDDLWHDTRASVRVSRVYARHLAHAAEEATKLKTIDDIIALDGLGSIARFQGGLERSVVDRNIGALVWHTSGTRAAEDAGAPSGFYLEAAERARYGEGDPLTVRDYTVTASSHEDIRAYQRAVRDRGNALGAAYRRAQPYALRREWALWQALAQAQTKPMRALYKSAAGAMDVWFFLTLPLRPGWVVRNVFDNTLKVMIHGARDPRYYFTAPGTKLRSIFECDLTAMLRAVRFLDKLFHTNAAASFEAVIDTFLHNTEDVVNRVFRAHAMPDVPEEWLEKARNQPFRRDPSGLPEALGAQAEELGAIQRWKNNVWEVMASRPENHAKRAIFRATYDKAIKSGTPPQVAYRQAWEKVEEVLFDYSKVTVIEDNFRVFFPFIQFWRKNTTLWIKTFATKPWLPADAVIIEDELRNELHKDWPEWARRYVHTEEVSSVLARVPGLEGLAAHFANQDAMYDPMNFFSFAPLYRAWKGENVSLPGDRPGWAFLAPFADAINDWGLGLSPFVRKPLEDLGVLNQRAWQTVFPETPMISALTRKYLGDHYADRIIDIDSWLGDPIFNAIDKAFNDGGNAASERVEQDFNYWVQTEMVNQRVRGEQVSRDRAVQRIQDFILAQQVVAFFSGVYARRMTPEDFYLYKLQEDLFNGDEKYEDLTSKQKSDLRLWRLRKVDRVAFDRYVEALPLIEAYYRQPDYAHSEAYKREHPEIITWVDPAFNDNPIPRPTVENAALVMDTEAAIELGKLVDETDISFDAARFARSYLVTPELRDFWDRNDTPRERQDKMIRGLAFQRLGRLQRAFFAIPEDDFTARQSFLADHPELERWWQADNDRADDYAGILTHLHADLRDRYFEYAEAGDWDGANAFLTAYPFIFDKINDDGYVFDRETGRPRGGGGGGGRSQHARDYLAAKPWLDYFFSLPQAQRLSWLNGSTPGAAVVRGYFDKWAHSGSRRGGLTQHASDYLAAKKWLDFYFSLAKAKRGAWLNGDSTGAATVLAYFKKYGRTNRIERSLQNTGLLSSRNAELNLRLAFWAKLFALPADQRPEFVHRNAERYGIFIYGVLGSRERHDREAAWIRRAIGAGVSERAAHYLYVKPLLDVFFTLGKEEKRLFLRANPELADYLDNWASRSASGDPKLDKLLEGYFQLPTDSQERTEYLRAHPEVQRYFDKHSSPAERAMHRLLEVYFSIRNPDERKTFLLQHPEVSNYFDRKQAERSAERRLFDSFDSEDPRLQELYADAARQIQPRADRMRDILHRNPSPALAVRRERQPTDQT